MVKAPGALRLLVGVSIVVAGLGLAPPPAAAAPALTVTPATGLLDQQVVTVTGSGFTEGEQLVVAQCAGALPDGCELDPPVNTTAAVAEANPDGAVEVTLRLARVLELESGDVSCADGDCSIVAVTRDDPTERARTAIDFEATGTAPPDLTATLAVSTSDMRADGGRGTLTGSGYLPWFRIVQLAFGVPVPVSIADAVGPDAPGAYLALCDEPPGGWTGCRRFVSPAIPAGSSGQAFKFHQWVSIAAGGTVVARTRELPRMWITDQGRVDCAVTDCRLALEQDLAPLSNAVVVPWAPEWSPWPSASAFVAAVYPALLGRPATASERAAAIADLTDRSTTGFTLLRQLAGRSDGRRLAELARLYQAALARRPDATGLTYWADELRRAGSISGIAAAFGRSPEFRQAFGPSVSDTEAVSRAYLRTLDRAPSIGERDYWVGRLQAGLARSHMIHLFSRVPEFVAREGGRSEVSAVTVALLRRGPTLNEWLQAGPNGNLHDRRTFSERADDGVLTVLSSNQLHAELA
ncbi:MAG TPA: DUF4214 domain-containing protein [Iamia sp.]